MESIYSRQISSKPHALQNTKNRSEPTERLIEIESVLGYVGIGGELGVPCTTNRLYGGLNASGRRKRLLGSCMRTSMSRPYMIRVLKTVSGRKRKPNNRGNRSGRERSIPTWGHGCCGDPGRRKCVDTACGYERPPEDSHLRCQTRHQRASQVLQRTELLPIAMRLFLLLPLL